MQQPTSDQTTNIPEQQRLLRRTASAFEVVFGQAGHRNDEQALVVEYLEQLCYRNRPIFKAVADGHFDTHRAAHIDGARTVILAIEEQLTFARVPLKTEPVKVIRKKKPAA